MKEIGWDRVECTSESSIWRSDECVMLQCEFDLAGGVFSDDIKDIVFKRFYNIAVNVL